MDRSRLVIFLLVGLTLLAAGCSGDKAPGTWTQQETRFHDAFYSIHFVDENVGWINAQADRSYEPTEEELARAQNQNANKRVEPPPGKKDENDPLKANQGFEVLQTTDGGATWKQIRDQFKHKIRSVWFAAQSTGWALTIDRDILHTSDGGATWSLQRKARAVKLKLFGNRRDPVMEMPEQIEHLRFIDPNHGWAWGGGRNDRYTEQPGVLLATLDGGQTWNEIAYPFGQNVYTLFVLDRDHLWASTEGDGFYKTTDGGLNWSKIESKLPEDVFRAIFFLDLNNGWVVGRSGRLAKTTDGGRTWLKMYAIKQEFEMRDVFFTDLDRGWAVGNKGTILYTPDGGETWLSLKPPVFEDLLDVLFIGRTGWAVGLRGALARYEPAR